jgi:dUTP pyrophosphatase
MLKVKKLSQTAKLPTVANPGEDIGYDLYANEDVTIPSGHRVGIKTGIAIEFTPAAGAILKCKSGLASQYASVEGGVIDCGYRGEIIVMIHNHHPEAAMQFSRGQKIAQMIEHRHKAGKVLLVQELKDGKRGEKGFGSSGKF